MGTRLELTRPRGKFHLDHSRASAQLGRRRELRGRHSQRQNALVQPDGQIALQRFGAGRTFLSGNRVTVASMNLLQHLIGDGDTGREIHFQTNLTGFDDHKGRLQILIEAMGGCA